MKKFFTFACAAAVALTAFADPIVSPAFTEEGDMGFTAEGMSEDHVFVAGSNDFLSRPVIWNTKDNSLVEFYYEGVFYPSLYDPDTWEFIGYDYENPQPDVYEGTFHAINKAGTAVGTFGSSYADKMPCYANVKDEEVTFLYVDEDEVGGDAYAITEDGSIIVGFHYDAFWMTHACVWRNGGQTKDDRYDLPMPSDEEFGSPIDYVTARWMSADAKVILGYAQDANSGSWVMLYWTANPDGTYTAHTEYTKKYYTSWEIDYDTWSQYWLDPSKPYSLFQPDAISANGEWVTLQLKKTYDLESYDEPAPQAGRLNLKTGALEVLDTEVEVVPIFYSIANNGTAVGTTPVMMGPLAPQRKALASAGDLREGYIWFAEGNDLQNVQELYPEDEYFNPEELLTEFNMAVVTSDAKYICGVRTATDGVESWEVTSFVIALPGMDSAVDNVKSDAKGIKLLENGQVVILRDGKKFNLMGAEL